MILIPMGTATIMVVVAKKALISLSKLTIKVFCAQTRNPRTPVKKSARFVLISD
jgi:ribosomal protein L13